MMPRKRYPNAATPGGETIHQIEENAWTRANDSSQGKKTNWNKGRGDRLAFPSSRSHTVSGACFDSIGGVGNTGVETEGSGVTRISIQESIEIKILEDIGAVEVTELHIESGLACVSNGFQ